MLPSHLFLGIISFQLLFVIIQWTFFKRREYGYYSLYIAAISLYFLLKYLADKNQNVTISGYSFNALILDKSLSFLSFGFYIKFGRKFLETKKLYPPLNIKLFYLETCIIVYSILNIIFVAVTKDFVSEAKFFSVAFGLAFLLSAFWLFRLLRLFPLSMYLIAGSFMLMLGAAIALYVGLSKKNMGLGETDNTLYLQLGVFVDFICLNIGLVLKTQLLQRESLEKERAVEMERLRISTELHDDVGGELSVIRILSEMGTANNNPKQQLSKIAASSGELVQKMNEIVWALNISNDNLQSLIGYLRRYAVKYLDDINIECAFYQPENIPPIIIDGFIRRNIFLLIKEALQNVAKHSNATKVEIKISTSDRISISIRDNGSGIPASAIINKTGNGIGNMERRVSEMKGNMKIGSANGSAVFFDLPVLSNNTKRG